MSEKRSQEQPKELTQTLQQTPVLPLLQAMVSAVWQMERPEMQSGPCFERLASWKLPDG